MGLVDKISRIAIGVLDNIPYKKTISGINKIFKVATPLILNNVVENALHSSTEDINFSDIEKLMMVKRNIGILNDIDRSEPTVDLVSFELISLVNSITNEINKLLSKFGEENVYIDELLIYYFINKFKVPKIYANKVFDILCNEYAIENKSIRDAYSLFEGSDENSFETNGGRILKYNEVNDDLLYNLYKSRMMEQAKNHSKKVITDFVR